MPSPFPGMDPYLEQHWGDVHHRLITYACDQLQASLPRDLHARVEERVFVESVEGVRRPVFPDIRIVGRGRRKAASAPQATGLALAEPLLVYLDEPATQGFIEIRESGSRRRLIAVIEVLSLANKVPGEGQNLYLKTQSELRQGQVSLVEIDLLRAGKRLLPVPLQRLPSAYRTPYQVVVRRGWQPIAVEIYRVALRERLPIVKIPLRQTDADVSLDLQTLLDQCYRNGAYDDDIDYTLDPDPPLERADARWAATLLRKQGLRRGRRPNPLPRRRNGSKKT